MNRTIRSISLGAVVGLALGCWRHDPDHCGSNLGDASCADGMFCDACEPDNQGCVTERPSLACHVAGEVLDDGESSSSTTTPSSTVTTVSGSGSGSNESGSNGSSTSGVPECSGHDECTDPATPLCNSSGECVSCDQLSDPNGACAELDPSLAVCNAGACVQCTADQAQACSGQTPVCGEANACTACAEHDQCPESACHLDGSNVGACFNAAEVVMVASIGELTTAIADIGNGRGVIVLAGSVGYNQTANIAGDAEIAILGPSSAILSGTIGLPSLNVGGNAIVYLGGPSVANGDANGVTCAGTSVWLDDSAVRNNSQLGMYVSGGCAAHLRRSTVASNDGGGIDVAGGSLSLRNAAIGRNGDALISLVGGIALNGTALDASYSSIVGNTAQNPARGSLFCSGGESGEIRNSILVGSGDSIDGCGALVFNDNAVDDAGLGGTNDDVGPAMPGWFVSLGTNDYHLTTSGETTFLDLAMWQAGDPSTDVDGDPIPTMTPSLPGYDQP